MDRTAPWTVCLFGYAVAIAVTLGVLYYGMRLENADLAVPFAYKNDALLILPLVKATVETGDHWTNARLGAPGCQELYDYPVVDQLHFLGIRVLRWYSSDPVVVFNLYYLLTYPLTTLTAMFALRRLGVGLPAAIALSVLYSFQPYHYLRGEVHYFLSAYYVVPLTIWLALRLCRADVLFFPQDSAGVSRRRLRDASGWGAIAVALMTASAGAYYAYFGCALLAAATVYGAVAGRNWRAPLVGFGLVGLIAAAGLYEHAPTAKYQKLNGENDGPHLRFAEESEMYGMKLAQLLLPVTGHNWQRFAALRAEYDAPRMRPAQNENEWDAIGLVASAGLVGLFVALFLPAARSWPYAPLASLALFAVLLGTIGGLGSLIGHLLTPQVRAYNRISIYVAFLALAAVGLALDRVTRSNWRIVGLFRIVGCGLLVWFGLWDQLNNTWFRDDGQLKDRGKIEEKFSEDREFFRRVEDLFPEGGAVFNYPHVPYPESAPVRDVDSYDHVRGYLHTDRLKWSFGAMKGREWDLRFRSLAQQSTDKLLLKILHMGFRAILVDKRGLEPGKFAELDHGIRNIIGDGNNFGHPDKTLELYDLRAYARYLEQTFGPIQFREMERRESEQISVLWLKGFSSYERIGDENRRHHARPEATMVIVNPTDRTRRLRIGMDFSTLQKDPTTLSIRGDIWDDAIEGLKLTPRHYERVLEIPPGRHTVEFLCPPPPSHLHGDSRRLFLLVSNFSKIEIDPTD